MLEYKYNNYYGLADQLVTPMKALWNLEFDGEGTDRTQSLQSYVATNLMRALIIVLRAAP